jgi:hypothetical protein
MNQQLASESKAPFQLKTIPQGAATSVWTAVVAPADEIGGHYCENCHVGNIVPDDGPITAISEGVRGYALDPNNADQFRLIGIATGRGRCRVATLPYSIVPMLRPNRSAEA